MSTIDTYVLSAALSANSAATSAAIIANTVAVTGTYRDQAEAAVGEAVLGADRSELALSAITTAVPSVFFDNTMDGIAGTLDEQWFATWEDARQRIYLNDAGTAVFKTENLTAATFSVNDGSGGGKVKYKSAIPTSAALLDVTTLGSRKADVRDWNGMDLTGANDCASLISNAAVQATTAGVKVEAPAGVILLGSTVEIPAGGVIEGVSGLYMASAYSGRTIFKIGHTGKGFTMTGAAGGRSVKSIATLRNQPAFTSGWAPTAHDWDFYTDGATDCEFEDILLINPTKGICHTNGGGRHSHSRVWGQPMQVGIQVDTSYDVTRSDNVHFWNFFSTGKTNESHVLAYMLANATAYYSKRNDNPDLSSIFSIFYRHGLRIGNWSGGGAGTTSRMRGFGIGMDACGSGITVDSDANGFTADLYGFYAHGHDTVITDRALVNVEGTNGTLRMFGRADLSNAHTNAIRVVGSGSFVDTDRTSISAYNMANSSHAAVYADPLAGGVIFNQVPAISGGVSGAANFNANANKIQGKLQRAYTPTITASSGTITTTSINSAVYDYSDGFVEVLVDFTISNNGTGASSILLSLPITSAAGLFSVGYGDEVATGGKMVRAHIPNNSTTCSILNYDNTYPGGTGARIVVRLKYRA